MADIRTSYNTSADGWFEYGDGDAVYTATYVASTQFKFSGVDLTSKYHVNRRVRVVAATPGTIYGTITVSAFSTDTTLTIAWDSSSLSNEAITSVHLGPAATNSAQPLLTSLAVTSSATGALGTLTSTDAGASEGPDLDLYRNSASPAANDIIGGIVFNGKDDAGNKQLYARIRTVITDPANTGPSEDGKVVISTIVAGVETDVVTVEQAAAKTGLYVAGNPVTLPLLQVLTASTSASLNFTGADNTKYRGYRCLLHRLLPATDAVNLLLRASTDQGSTLRSGSEYVNSYIAANSAAGSVAGGSGSTTSILIFGGQDNAAIGVNGVVDIIMGTAANDFAAMFNCGGVASDGATIVSYIGWGNSNQASINGFGFLMSSGNITSGTVHIYGIPKV